MLASILSKKGATLKNAGNYNNQIGLPLTLFNLSSKYLYSVLELGTSCFGEIKRLSEIAAPKVGVITNIGLAHLEGFKDLDGVLTEKKNLLESLPNDGWSVINKDDQYLSGLDKTLKTNIMFFGLNKPANVYATNLKLWPGHPKFDLHINDNSIAIELPVFGKFNIYNALAAAAAATVLGAEIELIKDGLENYSIPKMRMNVKDMVSGVTIVNDAYNANPSSMRESIDSLVQSFPDRDKIVVLGDMLELGQEAKMEHHSLGEFLTHKPLNSILLYGPLMENAFLAIDTNNVKYFKEKDELTQELKKHVLSQDVIFFKASRGMKFEEIISQVFSD